MTRVQHEIRTWDATAMLGTQNESQNITSLLWDKRSLPMMKVPYLALLISGLKATAAGPDESHTRATSLPIVYSSNDD